MFVQAACCERLVDGRPIEHVAQSIDTKAPHRTLAVLLYQSAQTTQLASAFRMDTKFAAFPARPGVERDLQQQRGFTLSHAH
jgi:hypothetical protein